MAETTYEVHPEIARTMHVEQSQEQLQEVVAPVEPTTVQATTAQQQIEENDKDRNFRALRDKTSKIQQERDELLYRLQQMEASKSSNQSQPSQQYSEDDDINLEPEAIAEGKHINKFNNKFNTKIKRLEQELNVYKQQSSEATAEVRLRAQYPDFDKVVSKDNIELLSAAYPELAKSINASSSLYDKAVSAYTLIKKFNIYNEEPYKAEVQRAQANAAKPKPLVSVSPQQGDSPLTQANAFANGLTDELKEQLRKEMFAHRRNF